MYWDFNCGELFGWHSSCSRGNKRPACRPSLPPSQLIINGETELPAIDWGEMNDTAPKGSIWILTGRIQKSKPSFDGARKKAFHWHTEGNVECWYRAMEDWNTLICWLSEIMCRQLNHCTLHSLKTTFAAVLHPFYKGAESMLNWSCSTLWSTWDTCQTHWKRTLTWPLVGCLKTSIQMPSSLLFCAHRLVQCCDNLIPLLMSANEVWPL